MAKYHFQDNYTFLIVKLCKIYFGSQYRELFDRLRPRVVNSQCSENDQQEFQVNCSGTDIKIKFATYLRLKNKDNLVMFVNVYYDKYHKLYAILGY